MCGHPAELKTKSVNGRMSSWELTVIHARRGDINPRAFCPLKHNDAGSTEYSHTLSSEPGLEMSALAAKSDQGGSDKLASDCRLHQNAVAKCVTVGT